MDPVETVKLDYRRALMDLVDNSKVRINVLTMLADEYSEHAAMIVQVIQNHIRQVVPTAKLYALYLVDSIIKNSGDPYRALFAECLADIFLLVFTDGNEKTRESLFRLRTTWTACIPTAKLYELDARIKEIDPAWPIGAQPTARKIIQQVTTVVPGPVANRPAGVQMSTGTNWGRAHVGTTQFALVTPKHEKPPKPIIQGPKILVSKPLKIDPAVTQRAQEAKRHAALMRIQKEQMRIEYEREMARERAEIMAKQKQLDEREREMNEQRQMLSHETRYMVREELAKITKKVPECPAVKPGSDSMRMTNKADSNSTDTIRSPVGGRRTSKDRLEVADTSTGQSHGNHKSSLSATSKQKSLVKNQPQPADSKLASRKSSAAGSTRKSTRTKEQDHHHSPQSSGAVVDLTTQSDSKSRKRKPKKSKAVEEPPDRSARPRHRSKKEPKSDVPESAGSTGRRNRQSDGKQSVSEQSANKTKKSSPTKFVVKLATKSPRSRGRSAEPSSSPEGRKKSDKKSSAGTTKNVTTAVAEISSEISDTQPNLPAIRPVVIDCGLEEEMDDDDDVEELTMGEENMDRTIKIEQCSEERMEHQSVPMQQYYNNIQERTMENRIPVLPPKKRKPIEFSQEIDDSDCRPRLCEPASLQPEIAEHPHPLQANFFNLTPGCDSSLAVTNQQQEMNQSRVPMPGHSANSDGPQPMENWDATPSDHEIEPDDNLQIVEDNHNAHIDGEMNSIDDEDVDFEDNFPRQPPPHHPFDDPGCSRTGPFDRGPGSSFIVPPVRWRPSKNSVASQPRPLLSIDTSAVIGQNYENDESPVQFYGQYSPNNIARPNARGCRTFGNDRNRNSNFNQNELVIEDPPLTKPKPRSLLEGYKVTKPKESEDQKPPVVNRRRGGSWDGPNHPPPRANIDRNCGHNAKWLRYKTNRFAIGPSYQPPGGMEQESPTDWDGNANAEEDSWADNDSQATEPANFNGGLEPPVDAGGDFNARAGPSYGNPAHTLPPEGPHRDFEGRHGAPPNNNDWSMPSMYNRAPIGPNQKKHPKPPKKPKNPAVLVWEQRDRLMNAAKHRLKAGEISQEVYDSIMADLRQMARYRRPLVPGHFYYRPGPRRHPLINEQDERTLQMFHGAGDDGRTGHQFPNQQFTMGGFGPPSVANGPAGPGMPSEALEHGMMARGYAEGEIKEEMDDQSNPLRPPAAEGLVPVAPNRPVPQSPADGSNPIQHPAAGLSTVYNPPLGLPRPPIGAIMVPPGHLGPNFDPNLLQPRLVQPGIPLLLPRHRLMPPIPPGQALGGRPFMPPMLPPPGMIPPPPPVGYFPLGSLPSVAVGGPFPAGGIAPPPSSDEMESADVPPGSANPDPESSVPSDNVPSTSSATTGGEQAAAADSSCNNPPVVLPPPAFEQCNPSYRKPSPVAGRSGGDTANSANSPGGGVKDAPPAEGRDAMASKEPKRDTSEPKDDRGEEDDAEDGDEPQLIVPSKTIFVDGRPYEVQYIGDTAVIERSGLPHPVYFQGPPREVVIDGTAHMLAFQEQKCVPIDGETYTLMFGAPARELILGGFPLRGNFGGPAIFIKIKGVTHKIQICGPPPEVKIDPEPDYELYRFMPNQQQKHNNYRPMYQSGAVLRPGMPMPPMGILPPPGLLARLVAQGALPGFPPPIPINPSPLTATIPVGPGLPPAAPPFNLDDLMANLVKAGLVPRSEPSTTTAATCSTSATSTCTTSSTADVQSAPQSSVAPPVARGPRTAFISQGVEPIERRQRSTRVLKEFNMRDLRVRYQSEIDSLYIYGLQCETCGLRYSEGDSERYSQHLDWHFQASRRSKTVQTHGWLLSLEDWIRYDEMDEEAAKAKHSVFETLASTQPALLPMEEYGVDESRDEPVLFAPDEEQSCEVCGEAFETYYDEDEDTWKIRNVIAVSDKLYHPICHQDASQQLNAAESIPSDTGGEVAPAEPSSIVVNIKKELMEPSLASIADTAFNIIETLKSATRLSTDKTNKLPVPVNLATIKQDLTPDTPDISDPCSSVSQKEHSGGYFDDGGGTVVMETTSERNDQTLSNDSGGLANRQSSSAGGLSAAGLGLENAATSSIMPKTTSSPSNLGQLGTEQDRCSFGVGGEELEDSTEQVVTEENVAMELGDSL